MRILTFLLAFLSFSISFSQNYTHNSIPDELLINADAVGRLNTMDIHIESVKKMTYAVTEVITVLNKSGERFAITSVGYDKEKKIKNLEAIYYNAEGDKIEHIKKRDFHDVSAVDGFSLYLDNRVLFYHYVPVEYPYTVEFNYEVETSDTAALSPWYFISGFGISVEESRYTITYATKDVEPIIKETNLSDLEVQKNNEDGHVSYISKNIKAYKNESLAPPFKDICPKLSVKIPNFNYKGYVGKNDDWESIGLWMHENLLTSQTELDVNTEKEIKQLVSDLQHPIDKAKRIYKYVQDNTRYISVQEGIGGLQPISAMEVDKLKYGDCKGLTNYTKALLEVAGVTSYYTRVYASSNLQQGIDKDFPTFVGQTNHVILNIPNEAGDVWLECTSQTLPFGFLGDFTDNRNVLVITPEGGKVMKTISYANEQNHQKMEATYNILEDRSIEGEVCIKSKGLKYDHRYGISGLSNEDINTSYKQLWSNINGIEIKGNHFNNDREKVLFTEVVKIKAPEYATKQGENLIVAINAFDNVGFVPTRYRNRKFPFVIKRGFVNEDEFKINIPQNFVVENLPDKVVEKSKFGSYEMQLIKKTDREFVYQRRLSIHKGEYPKEEYVSYRTFRRKVAKLDNLKLILTNQNPK